MAVTAYASADPAPQTNPNVDASVDLSAVALPQTVQLYGDAVDSTDGAATFTWAWTILAKPTGSTAALSSATAQNPTIDIDIWGNYLVALVATSSTTLVSSSDPLRMPDSATTVVRVLSASQGIQKPAAGERNWYDDVNVWADKIEALGTGGALPAHTLTQHTDVTDATGDDLEALTSGGYANAPANTGAPGGVGSLLHKHEGDQVDPATTSSNGVVRLDVTPANAAAPVVLTVENLALTATTTHSLQNGQIRPVIVKQLDPSGRDFPHATWYIGGLGTIEIRSWAAVLQFGGDQASQASEQYKFELYAGTQANVVGQALSVVGGAGNTEVTGNPASNGAPIALEWTGTESIDTSTTPYLAVVCTNDPEDATSGTLDPGALATFTVKIKRSV